MNEHQELATHSVMKLLVKYSIPAIIGMLVNALYNVVDRAFIGHIPEVGSLAITGIGITMPITTIILACGMLVGVGTTANISIKLGQGEVRTAERLIGNNITLSILMALILTIVGFSFKSQILTLFGASEQTFSFADSYISVILVGTLFNILGYSLNSNIRADGNPMLAAITMIIGCVINLILDPIFIFKFGWGIKGAAIATVISQAITAIWVSLYFIFKKSNLKFHVEDLKIDLGLLKQIVAIGSAPFAMQLAASLVQVISNNVLKTQGGDLAIGAMATISAISMMFLMPIFGVNQGSQPIIGYNYGAREYKRANQTFIYAIILSSLILTAGFLVIEFFPQSLIALFNKDEQLMAITTRGIRIYLAMFPFVSISITGSTYFQSIGKARIAMLLSLLRQLILLVPLIIVLPPILGLDGVWLAQPISDFLAIVITCLFIVREFKSMKKLELLKE